MYSFEGIFQSKRSQIFDRTEKETAASIVQKTREERRKRELLRRQLEAITKIQAFGRGILCRLALNRLVCSEFDNLIDKVNDSLSADSIVTTTTSGAFDTAFFHILRLFNWYCRRSSDKDRLFAVCRLFLSKNGRAAVAVCITTGSTDDCYALGRTLLVILKYLGKLPPLSASSEYTLPIRVVEEAVCHTSVDVKTPSDCRTYPKLAWLYDYLTRHGYFRLLARFIDYQVAPTAGYLTSETEANAPIFDPVEFARPPQTRAFLDLIVAPLLWASAMCPEKEATTSASASCLLSNVLASALNDVLVSDNEQGFVANERIVRGIGTRLFDTPACLKLVPHLCLSSLASDCSNLAQESRCKLIPSINLLHLLVTVVVPHLMSPDPILVPESHSPDLMETDQSFMLASPMSSKSVSDAGQDATAINTEVAVSVRCIAWLLMQTLRVPYLLCVRPIKIPPPLVLHSQEPDEESDTEEADALMTDHCAQTLAVQSQLMNKSYETHSLYGPTWTTQLPEIFTLLRRTLPSLASSALTTLSLCTESVLSCDSLPHDQYDLVRSLSQLHYSLTQVYGLPPTSMIGINSIYSQHPLYLRCLWYLIQNSPLSTSSAANEQSAKCSFFRILSSGELADRITDLQGYLPLIFAFSDCLNHRLLCLTDSEICGEDFGPKNAGHSLTLVEVLRMGCGFQSVELLQVGARLRDLMLGLIDLSHPDQLPKFVQPGTQYTADKSDLVGSTANRSNFRAVFERVDQRAEAAASGTILGATSILNRSGWSSYDLRLVLHCWTSLFRGVQRLVFQIYDWDRRSHRQSLIQSDLSALCLANNAGFDTSDLASTVESHSEMPTANQSLWIKENIASTIHMSLKSWIQHGGDRSTLTLTGVPFGYYSRLNPDCGQDPCVFSNREVRQVLILKELPFVIPFDRRVRLFQMLVESVRAAIQGSYVPSLAALATYSNAEQYPDVSILVRRTHMYEDAFEKLSKDNEPNLQPRLRVRFMNQVGAEEAGVDGGGLSREFLSELIKTGFDPTRGFFIYTAEKTLYPNPQAAAITEDYLKHYYFLGRMLAKAIYEGMLIEIQFAHFFLAKIASRSGGGVGFDYLHSLDPELYRQLRYLKHYEGNVRDLALDFTIVRSTFGNSETVELKPGGRQIPVTEKNRVEYMHLVAHYKLNKQIFPQVRAFTAGLNDVISVDWLRLFDADELQTLISGADMLIDIDDLQKHTVYTQDSGDYTETLKSFWSVLRNLSEEDKRSFLRFVTSCSRPPMFGFRDLQPPFSIQIIRELDRLPTASTCMNLLRLPNLKDPELLKNRLLYALHANAGFEYS